MGPVAFVVAGMLLIGPGTAEADSSGWRWPLDGRPSVIRRFDPPRQSWLAGHRGVDLAASPGRLVRAAGPGTVGFARGLAGRGVVAITHAHGLRTTYLPVQSSVRPGETVRAGDPIGVVEGSAGHCRTSCLHWGLLRGDAYLDPLLLVGPGQVRLLPRWGVPAAPRPMDSAQPDSAQLDIALDPWLAADRSQVVPGGHAVASVAYVPGPITGVALGVGTLLAFCARRAVFALRRRHRMARR